MSIKPYEQWAADAFEVRAEILSEISVEVKFDPTLMEQLVTEVEAAYATAHDIVEQFGDLLDAVLWRHEFTDDFELTAYKRWLGKVFVRRARRSKTKRQGLATYSPA